MPYMDRKESVTCLWFARAFSEHGWNVAESQVAAGSKRWILVRMELASFPDLPPPVLLRTKEPLQYDCKKQRTNGA